MPEPNIIHLTFQPLDFDARIKRTLNFLKNTGYNVAVAGPGHGLSAYSMRFADKLRNGVTYPLASLFGGKSAIAAHLRQPRYREALAHLRQKNLCAIHAHDWDALPVAITIGREKGIPVIYDSHEYAREMFSERMLWSATMSRAIARIEDECLPHCSAVITVSDGIGKLLRSGGKLHHEPVTLRNLPAYVEGVPRKPDTTVILHYHGILARGRGIEKLVETLELLPEHYKLRLLGPERQTGYLAMLRKLATEKGVADRLQIDRPVPPEQLVEAAASADIGFCLLDDQSNHNRFALPNKVFEYVMAGLFTVVSGSREMADLVSFHETGASVEAPAPQAIATLIQSLDRGTIDRMRAHNLNLAKHLNWEHEALRLKALYEKLGIPREAKAGD